MLLPEGRRRDWPSRQWSLWDTRAMTTGSVRGKCSVRQLGALARLPAALDVGLAAANRTEQVAVMPVDLAAWRGPRRRTRRRLRN